MEHDNCTMNSTEFTFYIFMFDLDNEGKVDGAQHSQRSYLIANINLYKSSTWEFFASSHRVRDIHISKFVTLKI